MFIFGIVISAILFAIGAPLYLGFALGGIIIIVCHMGFPISEIGTLYFAGIDSFPLLAGLLFILAGNLMMHGGVGKPLIDFLGSFTARLPGGMAIATIIACAFMGALTGSTAATIASVGIIMFPAMVGAKYDKGYSAGVLCSAGNLGNLIPPSVFFIIYGFLTEQPIAELFVAGVVPGLLLALLLSVTALVIAKRRLFPLMPSVTWKERGRMFLKALPGIFMPVIILGGIYGGIFTPTEAAAVACVYCILISTLVYRGLTWKNILISLRNTTQVVGQVLIMIAGGILFGKAFILVGFPQAINSWVVNVGISPMGFLFLLTIAFMGLGCIMDGLCVMFVTIPLIMPAVIALEINLIHLGVIFCFSVLISGITPPVSMFLYFTAGLFETRVAEVMRSILPFLVITIIVLFIIVLFPWLSLWLPGTMQ